MRGIVFRERSVDAIDKVVRAARNGQRVINHPPKEQGVTPPGFLEVTPDEAIAAWLASNKVKKLPKRKANAPPILAIRNAALGGNEITFPRGRGRSVTYRPTLKPSDV